MPSAFQMARRRQATRKLNKSLNTRFEAVKTTHFAAGVGAGGIYIDGRVYHSTSAVTATEVVNIGRPAAAIYAPTTGGGTATTTGGGSVITGGTTDLSPALGAPVLMVAADANYTNERVFAPSGDFDYTDNGAGGTYVLEVITTADAVTTPNRILKPDGGNLILDQVTMNKATVPIIESPAGIKLAPTGEVWITANVGIGPTISDPEHLLHIYHNAATAGVEIESGPSSDAYLRIGKSSSTGVEFRYDVSEGLFIVAGGSVGTYGSPAIVVDPSTGYVGVGAATPPTVALQVTGAATVSTSVATPLLTTVTGDLNIAPNGTSAVKFPNETPLRSYDFQRSFILIEGWRLAEEEISGQSVFTVGKIVANELYVDVFVANETRVDRGQQLWAKSYGITTEPWTTPTIGSSVRFRYEDSPALNAAIFSNTDWLLFRVIEIGTGLTVANVWGQVSSYTDEDPTFEHEQSWLFTMRAGPEGMEIPAGMLAVDLGQSGQALIELSTVDPTGAPYIKLRRWTGDNPYTPSNYITHMVIGELSGIGNAYYTPDGYGFFIRPGAAADRFMVADNNVFQIRGVDLEMFNSTLQTVDLSSTDGSLKLGTNIASPATTTFSFNGTTGDVEIKGSLEAAGGQILINDDGLRITGAADPNGLDDVNAVTFVSQADNLIGGLYGGGSTTTHHVELTSRAPEGGATFTTVTAYGDTSTSTGAAEVLLIASNDYVSSTKEATIRVSADDTEGKIRLIADDYIQFESPVISFEGIRSFGNGAVDLGDASHKWRVLYVNQVIADSLSGATMSGAEWEYAGSMVIDANADVETVVSVINSGAGGVTVNVVGALTVSGTNVSLNGHNHDGQYPSISLYSAHVANANAHHNQAHVFASAAGLGADHTVSGLTAGHVVKAISATVAAFAQLNHSELGNLTTGHPHTQYLLVTGGNVSGNITASLGVTFDGVDLDVHVANANAHHAQQHVLATTAGLGADHTVSGLTLGLVLRATGASTATFSQLLHSELGNLTVGDPHPQYILAAGDTMTGPLLIASGLVTAPGLAFDSDGNSGLYRSAADVWHLVAGATAIVTVAATGATVTGLALANGALGIDSAVWAHSAHGTVTNYALQQTAAGRTIVNGATAQTVDLSINNVVQWSANTERLLPRGSAVVDIGDYNRQVRAAYISELVVQTLVAEDILATVGGDILVTPTTKLIADIASSSGGIGLSTLYTSLTSYWSFEESALPFFDSKNDALISNGNNLTKIVGKQGTGIAFDGTQDINSDDITTTRVGDIPFYISGWVYIGNDTGATRYIAFNGVSLGGERAWALYLTGSVGAQRMRFQVWNNGMSSNTTVTATSFGNLAINTWYFVECWHSSSANQIGVAINRTENTAAWSNGVNPDIGEIWFGSAVGSSPFTGQIDEFGFWKSYLPTTTERNFLYNAGAGQSFYNIRNYLAVPINFDVEHNSLRAGEYVMLKTAPAGIQQTEKFYIVSGPSVITGGYRYTANRDLDSTSPNNWYVGDAVASLQKNAGEGYLWLTAKTTVHGHTGPSLIGYVRTGTGVDDVKPMFVKGNLRSFVDYVTDEYGDAAGNDLTLTPAGGFAGYTIDRSNGLRLFNTDLLIYEAATKRFEILSESGMSLLADDVLTNQRQIISWYRDLGAKSATPAAHLLVYTAGTTNNMNLLVNRHTGSLGGNMTLGVPTAFITLAENTSGVGGGTLAAGSWSMFGDLNMNGNDLRNVQIEATDITFNNAGQFLVTLGIPNWYLGVHGGTNPLIGFDGNDYMLYDRDNDVLGFSIGNVFRLNIAASGYMSLYSGGPSGPGFHVIPASGVGQQAALIIGDTDAGNSFAPYLYLGRNSNASTPSAGWMRFARKDNNYGDVWVDTNGMLRIAANSGVTSTTDFGGTIVGTQSSALAAKSILGPAIAPEEAIGHIVDAAHTALRRFTYKSGGVQQEEFEGVVVDYAPRYGMDRNAEHPAGRSLNEITLFSDLIQSVEYLLRRVEQLEQRGAH